jgi:hypothetical protein
LFILFNDFILIGTRPGTLMSGKCKFVMRLEGMTLIDEPNADDYKNAFRVRGDDQNYLVCAPNPSAKEKWLEAIREQLTEVKKTLNTSSMSAKDFENIIKKSTPKAEQKSQAMPASTGVSGPMNVTRVGGQGPNILDQMKKGDISQSTRTMNTGTTSSTNGDSGRGQPPPPPGNPNIRGDWEKILDDASGDYYYENLKTGITTWDEPSEFSNPAPIKKDPPPPPPNLTKTVSTQQVRPTQVTQPVKTTMAIKTPTNVVKPTTVTKPTTDDSYNRPVPDAPLDRGPPPPPPGLPGSGSTNGNESHSGRGPPPPPPGGDTYSEPEPVKTGPPPPGSLQDQIAKRAGGLKKAQPQAKRATVSSPGGLNQALKQSLDRYRKFVQDDEEDLDQTKDDEGWAD